MVSAGLGLGGGGAAAASAATVQARLQALEVDAQGRLGVMAIDTASNDIGLLWPPARPPWVVAAYLADSRAAPAARDRVLAQVGQLVSALSG